MPGFGSAGGDGADSGSGSSPRQRLALVVSAVTLIGAMLVVLVLSPRKPVVRPPKSLLGYGEGGAVAAFELHKPNELRNLVAGSGFAAVARRGAWGKVASWARQKLLRFVPASLFDLAPLAKKLSDLDVALFLYLTKQGMDFALVARGTGPSMLKIPTEKSEDYRGHRLHAFMPSKGRQVHISWRGAFVLVASTRNRLKRLVDRHVGEAERPFMTDPGFRRARAVLPVGDRVFGYIDLEKILARAPWSELRGKVLEDTLGTAQSVAFSFDSRPRGFRLFATTSFSKSPSWLTEAAKAAGTAGRISAQHLAPKGLLAFAAARFDPAFLKKRLSGKKPSLPKWLAATVEPVSKALGKQLGPTLDGMRGEATLGLVDAGAVPSLYAGARMKRAKLAAGAYHALKRFVPAPLEGMAGAAARLRYHQVKKVQIALRPMPLGEGHGVGYGRDWVFGGGGRATRKVARAMGKNERWRPSALAQEVFAPASHLCVWIDAERGLSHLHRASQTRPLWRKWLARLGRLPNVIRSVGASVRISPRRLTVRLFARLADLK